MTEATTKATNEVSLKRAVKMTQTAEAGSEEKTARRIRNPNSCHTVTFNFFQIVKLFDIQLRLTNDAVTVILPGLFPPFYTTGGVPDPARPVKIPYWAIEAFSSPAVFLTQFFQVDRDLSQELNGWALRVRTDPGTASDDAIIQLIEALAVAVKSLLKLDPSAHVEAIAAFVRDHFSNALAVRERGAASYGKDKGRSEQITSPGIYVDSLLGRCTACEDDVAGEPLLRRPAAARGSYSARARERAGRNRARPPQEAVGRQQARSLRPSFRRAGVSGLLDRKTGTVHKRTAPAHKTGVGEAVPEPSPGEGNLPTLISAAEKSLDALSTAIARYATQRGGEEAKFGEILQRTLVEAAKDSITNEAVAVVEKAPLGKTILVTIRLADAFADGVGNAVVQVNQQIQKEQEEAFARLPAELDEQAVSDINRLFRGYQARSTQELPRVLGAGVVALADQAVLEILQAGVKLTQAVVKDSIGQLTNQLIKQREPFALFSQAAREASDSIPAARRQVEAMSFSFAATTFIRQLSDERLRRSLEGIQPLINAVGSREKIDVAILSSIIQIIVDQSFERYAKAIDLAGARREVEFGLIEQARILVKRTGIPIEVASGNTAVASLTSIAVPGPLKADLTSPREGPTPELDARFRRRDREFIEFVQVLRATVDAKTALFQLRIDRLKLRSERRVALGQSPLDLDSERVKLQNQLVDEANDARRRAEELRDVIVGEFGKTFHGGTVAAELDLTIFGLLRRGEVPRPLVDRPVSPIPAPVRR